MAASLPQDSDSDFGYDFSAEEEDLLLQLASNPHTNPANGAAVNAVTGAIDTVPGKTDIISRGDDEALQSPAARQLLFRGDSAPRAIPPEVDSRTPVTPAALDAGVSYPDCASTA